MKVQNVSKETVILGGYHDKVAGFSVYPLILAPLEIADVADGRLDLYDADVRKKVIPVAQVKPAVVEPLKQPAPAQPSQEELEAALMAAKLAEVNK